MSDTDCAAILLAAGASTRLGRPKQLIRLHHESLLRRTARLAVEAACAPIFVVLGFEAEQMRQELHGLNVHALLNPDWPSGMASSLHCGVQALLSQNPVPDRVMLLLCDQPFISSDLLQSLLQKNDENDALITASFYADKLAVPAIFRQPLYPEMQKVKGDQGARQIIQMHRGNATSIPFPDGTIDIDTVEDLKAISSD
jgi:molybdenum cofactor cytidylyltransferase